MATICLGSNSGASVEPLRPLCALGKDHEPARGGFLSDSQDGVASACQTCQTSVRASPRKEARAGKGGAIRTGHRPLQRPGSGSSCLLLAHRVPCVGTQGTYHTTSHYHLGGPSMAQKWHFLGVLGSQATPRPSRTIHGSVVGLYTL